MHLNSKLMFEKYAASHFAGGMRVLEIGPDSAPSTYRTMVGDDSITWDTIDIAEHYPLTYVATSEYTFPIPDDQYDLVLSAQVLEHVRKTWVWIKEVARVCKPNGLVITVNPVSWPYHASPVDCWRAFPDGMKALYEEASLEVLLSEWGSLETEKYRWSVPGRSVAWHPNRRRHAAALLGRVGFPVECAYDTITVGRKTQPAPG